MSPIIIFFPILDQSESDSEDGALIRDHTSPKQVKHAKLYVNIIFCETGV